MPCASVSRLQPTAVLLSLLLALLGACSEESRETVLSRAETHLQNFQPEAAASLYRELLQENPEDVDALAGLIAAAEMSGATEELAYGSENLLRFRPWDRTANLARGKVLIEEGKYADAISRFLLALEQSEFKLDQQEAVQHIHQARHALLQAELKRNTESP
jgi:Flp pilus assembly protein TadD